MASQNTDLISLKILDIPDDIQFLVRTAWYSSHNTDGKSFEFNVTNDGCSGLIYIAEGNFTIGLGNKTWRFNQSLIFAGPSTEQLRFSFDVPCKLFGLRFQPWSAGAVFKSEIGNLRNNFFPADNNLIQESIQLENTLKNIADEHRVLHTLWDYMRSYQNQDFKPNKVLSTSINLMNKNPSAEIKEIASQSACSVRELQRLFTRFVGITPKRFLRLIRIRKSKQEIAVNTKNLSEISLESGYYDQSHFIRDFKSHIMLTPSKYRKLKRS